MTNKYFLLLQSYSPTLIRISLAIVYVWFGFLKIFGLSPVANLVTATYPHFPEPFFLLFLGLWEVVIGIGLLTKVFLKVIIILLFVQMGGIFMGVFLQPPLYFQHGNFFLLSSYGEFVVKNFVLVAAALFLWPVKK